MSIAYYLLAQRMPILVRRPIAMGAAYGLFLYGFMRFVIVPLSAAGGGGSRDVLWVVLSIVVHMVLVGVPIALAARHALRIAERSESRVL